MIVTKFGGTSVQDAEAIQRLVQIVTERRAETPLVVVSALAGVTNLLVSSWPDGARMREAVATLASRHRSLLEQVAPDAQDDVLTPWLERLRQLAEAAPSSPGPAPHENDAALQRHAEWLALGELCSSAIVAVALRQRVPTTAWFDARRAVRTRAHDRLNDHPDTEATRTHAQQHLLPQLQQHGIVVTQGFIAADAEERTTLLGRGGSDLSASLLGAGLDAARIEIWTDVDGILTGPPRLVPTARRLKMLSFDEAAELSYFGAHVLHPATVRPARLQGIPVLVANARRGTHGPETGTMIVPEGSDIPDERSVVRSVAIKRGITVITVRSSRMLMAFGFLERIFAVFSRHETAVDLVSTSEVSVSLTLDETHALDAIVAELGGIASSVEVHPDMAIVCIVGAGMRRTPGIAARIFRAVGDVEVRMISQGASEVNVSLVVSQELADGVVRRLHDEFFTGNLPRDVFGAPFQDIEFAHAAASGSPRRQARLAGRAADLAVRYGTPLYVYDLDLVESQVKRLRAAFVHPRCRLAYACKANFHPDIFRLMRDMQVGIDAVSPMEVDRALECGIPAREILFTANNVGPEMLVAVLERGVRVNLGARSDARRLARARPGIEVFLRCNPGVGDGHHPHVVTGGHDSKFGILEEDLPGVLEELQRHRVRVVGLHAHIGSGILDPAPLLAAAQRLVDMAGSTPDVRELNIGGGLGVPYRADDAELDIESLGGELARLMTQAETRLGRELTLTLEPGRYLVAQAGTLLARVTCRKESREHVYIGLDTGMNHLLRPALYGSYHDIVNVTSPDAPIEFVDIVGNICESSDVFAFNRPIAAPQEGDLLAIEDTGAYGFVMASHYNLWPLPREVALRQGQEVVPAPAG